MTTAHFKYFQAERLNVINVSSSRTLLPEISGSILILDNSSSAIEITLPKPESGLHYKFIIKTKNDNTSVANDITIKSTSNDISSSPLIYFTGVSGMGTTLGTQYSAGVTNNITKSSVTINNFVISGDRLEFITDGENWYGTGVTKHNAITFT